MVQALLGVGRRFGADPRELTRGLSLSYEALAQPPDFVPWDDYCALIERLEALAGGAERVERPFDADDPFVQRLAILAGLLNSARALMVAALRFIAPRSMPHVRFDARWAEDGRLWAQMEIPPTARGCEPLLRMVVQRARVLSTLLGEPAAEIEHELTPHRLSMRIRFPERPEGASPPRWAGAFAELRAAQGALRLLFERMPSAVAIVRGERLMFGNAAWLALTGAGPLERAVGESVLQTLHADDVEGMRGLLGSPGAAKDLTVRFLQPDGAVRWARVVSADEVELLGEPARLLVVSDVTEQRRTELLQRTLLEVLPDIVFHLRADGTILAFAGGTAAKLPVPRAALLGRTVAEVARTYGLRPEAAEQAQELLRRTVATQTPQRAELGHLQTFELRTYPLGSDEVLVLGRDLTDQREVQAKVMLSERMAALGTLAAGVAHEVNNPLTYVLGNLEAARRELERAPAPLPALACALDEAYQGANRVARIVGDLRAFTRGDETGTGPVSLVEVLDSALRMVAGTVRPHGQLQREVHGEPWVLGNEARLAQVFLNLLVNALQALPEEPGRGVVRVVVRPRPPDRVEISFQDNGQGMTPQVRERIFDPFFTTKPVGVGTGLGLTICHRLVTSMGGEIQVQSEPGKGSTFTVLLPRASPPERPAASPPPPEPPSGRWRVLVVDDEPLVASVLRRILEGHDLTLVGSGQEALAQLKSQSFDVVFCDVMMPGLSGVQVFEQLPPERRKGFVFMTGGVGSSDVLAFLTRSGQPWLDKPFTLEQVRAALAKARSG